jgi:Ca2+-binding RTX toxin-like protein
MVAYFSRSDLNFSFPAGSQGAVVRDVFFADVNGDNRPDAVVTYEYFPLQNQPIPVQVLLGDGHGSFSDNAAGVFAGAPPGFVDAKAHAAADFNGDGRTDLFFANTGYEQSPYAGGANGLLLSSPSGLTDASSSLPGYVAYNSSASAGDINGDGRADVLVAAIGDRGPYFLINDGSGHFQVDTSRIPSAIANPANGQYATALLFDANNDGKADLFLGGDGDSKILLNDGTGHFVVPVGMTYPIAGQHNVVDAVSADVNGDGLPDVIETVAYNNFSQGGIRILINNGQGIFTDGTDGLFAGGGLLAGSGAWIRSVQVGDFDGDGAPDLLLSGGAQNVILLNDGGGLFAPLPGATPVGLLDRAATTDLNGDGRSDILVRTADPGGVEHLTVFLSQPFDAAQTGTDGPDGMMGTPGPDTLDAMGGDDVILASAGNDAVRAFDGNDWVDGGYGDDSLNGNMGQDTVHGGPGADFALGGQGNDLVYGDDGNDDINGNRGDDIVYGGRGDDIVHGGQGNDVLFGEDGRDFLTGDLGDDTLVGGPGADTFQAGPGVDRVLDFSQAQGDAVHVDAGATYTVSQRDADTVIDLGAGNQLILVGVQSSSLTPGWIIVG